MSTNPTGRHGAQRIEGELYLTLEVVAEVYAVEITWLRRAYDHGLLGPGTSEGIRAIGPCIAAAQLERVGTLLRLRAWVGNDLDALDTLLDP